MVAALLVVVWSVNRPDHDQHLLSDGRAVILDLINPSADLKNIYFASIIKKFPSFFKFLSSLF